MALDISKQIIRKVIFLEDELGIELAFGLSGSQARGTADKFSDVDICVFVEGKYPPSEDRRTAYTAIGFTAPIYFDVDFDTSRGDGFTIKGIRCDFNWMALNTVRTFLGNLGTDFDCHEWLPGGLATVKSVHDPRNVIIDLQALIPAYPTERSRYRVQRALQDAHYSLYQLEWLPKAAHRGDTFSFLKGKYLMLEKFFYTIFALNRVWISDEKRLTEKVMDFEFIPCKTDQRIQTIILHSDGSETLANCLMGIKVAFQRYGGLRPACLSRFTTTTSPKKF